ncbi:MAG TPA: phosphatidylserine decarboxylase [bacterium]|nr:phosphatidylserine decarboxylase [bacterium]HPN43626.1 phosphatidylserine decarboxylase [bacterium]
MNKEGLTTVFGILLFALIFGIVGYVYNNQLLYILAGLGLLLAVFSVYFFRDPLRTPPVDPSVILAPADGQVIDISQVQEPVFIEAQVTRVTIFMTVFNVHVNYVPFNGTVEYLKYSGSSYHRANLDNASQHNVHSFIGLETPYGKLAFKQITGMIARRVVCNLKFGQEVKTGQKFGIIKFGSRVEVFLPSWATVTIKQGDRLRAGESVIAKINEK